MSGVDSASPTAPTASWYSWLKRTSGALTASSWLCTREGSLSSSPPPPSRVQPFCRSRCHRSTVISQLFCRVSFVGSCCACVVAQLLLGLPWRLPVGWLLQWWSSHVSLT